MTRTMYDSTTPRAIPLDAQMVALYDDGEFAATAEDWALFPGAVHVHITVFAGDDKGDVLDVETGDASPIEAAGWIKRRRAAGLARPTIYVNRNNVLIVIRDCGAAGLILGRDWWIWLATLDGTDQTNIPHVVAIQNKSAAMLGRNTDSSDVKDDTWHPSPLTDAQKLDLVAELAKQIIAVTVS